MQHKLTFDVLRDFVFALSDKEFRLLTKSVDERSETIRPGGKLFKTFVDGIEYKKVIRANIKGNWIEIAKTDKNGKLNIIGDNFETEIKRGKITLETFEK